MHAHRRREFGRFRRDMQSCRRSTCGKRQKMRKPCRPSRLRLAGAWAQSRGGCTGRWRRSPARGDQPDGDPARPATEIDQALPRPKSGRSEPIHVTLSAGDEVLVVITQWSSPLTDCHREEAVLASPSRRVYTSPPNAVPSPRDVGHRQPIKRSPSTTAEPSVFPRERSRETVSSRDRTIHAIFAVHSFVTPPDL